MTTTPQSRTRDVDGIPVPRFLYGTAWKEDATQRLTELALEEGFRGIDTANQRKHYVESAVGDAVALAISSEQLRREELFLQTKFTFRPGQDHRLPYDPGASIADQVAQSFKSSLEHLQTEQIDSYVLHGPSQGNGLGAADWEAWRAMEALRDSGRVRFLGISNVSLEQLQQLFQRARIAPKFVQNRCYAVRGWDRSIRNFCAANNVIYQGFSLLTANRQVLESRPIVELARKYQRTPSQIVFRFALDVGMLPLTGTTNVQHMREDLGVFDFQLAAEEVAQVESIAAR